MIIKENIYDIVIDKPRKAAKLLYGILELESEIDQKKEHFWSIGLDIQKNVAYVELVTLGILDSIIIHPREIYRTAIIAGVHSIITAHNHPSGNPTPSVEDIKMVRRLSKAGKIIGIPMLYHIIIGNNQKRFKKL